ncbi:unnamed protein product [Diamesa hyperborea]
MDIQAAINTPFIRIRLIAFVHFSLIVNALIGHWLPQAYMFYNILFMVTLMWAIHSRESVDAIHAASAINMSSFFFDLIIIISFFPNYGGVWSAIFAIVNMAARPFTLLLLHKELVDRGGDFVLVTVPSNNNRTPRNYEDIDRTNNQSVPPSHSTGSNINNLF